MAEKEITLIDFINILLRRKWLIIIPTFILVVVVGIISFLLPPKWAVDTIIEPARFSAKITGGSYVEVLTAEPEQLARQINKATYNHAIAAELKLDITAFPKIKAENLEGTKLVYISTVEKDTDKAKRVLHTLYTYIKKELDTKTEIERKEIDAEINSNEIEKNKIKEEIKILKKKLKIIQQRMREINKEMQEAQQRIKTLEEDQQKYLMGNKSEAESLGMLLYNSQIQLSLRYYNTLNETLSSKKIAEEDINLEIEEADKKIGIFENTINNLNQLKGRIDDTKLVKEPTSSIFPVYPKKMFNILIAGIICLVVFTLLAFFLDFYEKQEVKLPE